ncbi:MAG: hypothetical protein M5U34_39985 [Chloroflexi bacterium]|nr:hypothetical protein [Chloroflexota bacterium]
MINIELTAVLTPPTPRNTAKFTTSISISLPSSSVSVLGVSQVGGMLQPSASR